jgi:vacuolar-type H+-ATPase subunit F/Vma7
MVEILSNHFTEEENTKVETEIEKDSSFKEVYDKIKDEPNYRMLVLQEKVDKTEENFQERFEAFKKAVLEAEKKQSPADKIQQTIEEKIKEKKEEAMKALKEKADKVLPF